MFSKTNSVGEGSSAHLKKKAAVIAPADTDEVQESLEQFGIEAELSEFSLNVLEDILGSIRKKGVNAIVVGFDASCVDLPRRVASQTDLPVVAFPCNLENMETSKLKDIFWDAAQSNPSDALSMTVSSKHAAECTARICNSRADIEVSLSVSQKDDN